MRCSVGRLTRRNSVTLWMVLVLAVSLGCFSCKNSKNDPTGPDGNPDTTSWHLRLIYHDTLTAEHYDTIGVRLFDPTGALRAGVIIDSRAAASPDSVSRFVTTSLDTSSRWWGSNYPIMYWGTGGTSGGEVVTCLAIDHGDTVASALASFKVRPHP